MARIIRISKNNDTFYVSTGYELKDYAKKAGCRWDPDRKVWVTRDVATVALVVATATKDKVLVDMDAACRAAIAAKRSPAQEEPSPAPTPVADLDKLPFLPFQREGIQFIASRRAALLADEMGLGKTVQALGVINYLGLRKVLVITPKSLMINWQREAARWLAGNVTVGIATTKQFPDTNVVIINYDIVAKCRAEIDAKAPWDLVVLDEAHYVKNTDAARTKAILGSKELSRIAAERWLFLTGTPVLNRPVELWPMLRVLDPDGLGRNWRQYVVRYCAGHQTRFGWDVSGASNLNELAAKLQGFMLRRRKEEVLHDLPAKRRSLVVLPENGAADAVEAEAKLLETLRRRIAQAKAEAEAALLAGPDAYDEAVAELRKVRMAAITEIAKARHKTGLSKVPAIIEFIEDQEIDKVVVFSWHKDVAEKVYEAFGDAAVLVHGDTPLADRDAAVTRFQNDPNCRVFVGTISAAGVGLTLTAASTVIFAEMAWTPALMAQAEDRCHRIGQASSVNVYHLVYDRTVDANIAKVLAAKEDIIGQITDNDMIDAVFA